MNHSPIFHRIRKYQTHNPHQQPAVTVQQVDESVYSLSMCVPDPAGALFIPPGQSVDDLIRHVKKMCDHGRSKGVVGRNRSNPFMTDYGTGVWNYLIRQKNNYLPQIRTDIKIDFSRSGINANQKIAFGRMVLQEEPVQIQNHHIYEFNRRIDPANDFGGKNTIYKDISSFTMNMISDKAFSSAYKLKHKKDNPHQSVYADLFIHGTKLAVAKHVSYFARCAGIPVFVATNHDSGRKGVMLSTQDELLQNSGTRSCYFGDVTMSPYCLFDHQQISSAIRNTNPLYGTEEGLYFKQQIEDMQLQYNQDYRDLVKKVETDLVYRP